MNAPPLLQTGTTWFDPTRFGIVAGSVAAAVGVLAGVAAYLLIRRRGGVATPEDLRKIALALVLVAGASAAAGIAALIDAQPDAIWFPFVIAALALGTPALTALRALRRPPGARA